MCTNLEDVGNNFALTSIFERMTVFGRVLEVVPQALLESMSWVSSPLGGRRARCFQWIDRPQKRTFNLFCHLLCFIKV